MRLTMAVFVAALFLPGCSLPFKSEGGVRVVFIIPDAADLKAREIPTLDRNGPLYEERLETCEKVRAVAEKSEADKARIRAFVKRNTQ